MTDDIESAVDQVEAKSQDVLRRQEAIERDLRESMDSLRKGHPETKDWQAQDNIAGSYANLTAVELGGSAAEAFQAGESWPAEPYGAYEHGKEAVGHLRSSWNHRSEMLEAREGANTIKEEWETDLRQKMDGLQMRREWLEVEKSKVVHEAEGIKAQVEHEASLATDSGETQQEQRWQGFATRLDALTRRLA